MGFRVGRYIFGIGEKYLEKKFKDVVRYGSYRFKNIGINFNFKIGIIHIAQSKAEQEALQKEQDKMWRLDKLAQLGRIPDHG